MDSVIAEKLKNMRLPFAELLGITIQSVDRDKVVAKMLVRDDLCTVGQTLHGGAVMSFADTVGAVATFINLPGDARGTTTLESKTNFLAAASVGGIVTATATPVHRGRRTQVWQTRIETGDGRLVALVTQTQMVL
jgi:1,4-dihydroxy-2-naphthoyl-CoA hydrolase